VSPVISFEMKDGRNKSSSSLESSISAISSG